MAKNHNFVLHLNWFATFMSVPIPLKRYIRAKTRREKKREKDKKELAENAQKENKIYNKKLFPQAEKE